LTLGCAITACGDDGGEVLPPKLSQPPIVLDEQVVFVDGDQTQAFLLDLSQSRPKAQTERFELPPRASAAVRRNLHNEALILCAGERELEESDAAPASLVVIAADGVKREYELGTTSFNTLTQSDDGRYAIAYRNGETPGRTLDNPNELVVVDLDRKVDEDGAVTGKSPAGLAHTLNRVIVSPSMTIADEERRLLVLLSAAEVSVFDLNHLERRPRSCSSTSDATSTPRKSCSAPASPRSTCVHPARTTSLCSASSRSTTRQRATTSSPASTR
jgi:hypothetical protein